MTLCQPTGNWPVPSTSSTTIKQALLSPEVDFGLAEDPGYVLSPRDPLESSTDCGNSDNVEGWETMGTMENDENRNDDDFNNLIQ